MATTPRRRPQTNRPVVVQRPFCGAVAHVSGAVAFRHQEAAALVWRLVLQPPAVQQHLSTKQDHAIEKQSARASARSTSNVPIFSRILCSTLAARACSLSMRRSTADRIAAVKFSGNRLILRLIEAGNAGSGVASSEESFDSWPPPESCVDNLRN